MNYVQFVLKICRHIYIPIVRLSFCSVSMKYNEGSILEKKYTWQSAWICWNMLEIIQSKADKPWSFEIFSKFFMIVKVLWLYFLWLISSTPPRLIIKFTISCLHSEGNPQTPNLFGLFGCRDWAMGLRRDGPRF